MCSDFGAMYGVFWHQVLLRMANITMEDCSGPPPQAEWDAFMKEYYGTHVARMARVGFVISEDTVQKAIAEYWDEVDAYLPPRGQTLLARGPDGALIGSGVLKRLDDGTGELKRLYVRPAARGAGLGRRLVEMRIAKARDMGLRKLLVDTLTQSTEMRALYSSLDFKEVAPNLGSTTAKTDAALVAHTVFFEYDLEG